MEKKSIDKLKSFVKQILREEFDGIELPNEDEISSDISYDVQKMRDFLSSLGYSDMFYANKNNPDKLKSIFSRLLKGKELKMFLSILEPAPAKSKEKNTGNYNAKKEEFHNYRNELSHMEIEDLIAEFIDNFGGDGTDVQKYILGLPPFEYHGSNDIYEDDFYSRMEDVIQDIAANVVWGKDIKKNMHSYFWKTPDKLRRGKSLNKFIAEEVLKLHRKNLLENEKVQIEAKLKLLSEEGPFNDAGEPLMTHSQYRDYSEPSYPEYDDRDDHSSNDGVYGFNNINWEFIYNTLKFNDKVDNLPVDDKYKTYVASNYGELYLKTGLSDNILTSEDEGVITKQELQHMKDILEPVKNGSVYTDGVTFFDIPVGAQPISYEEFLSVLEKNW